MFCLRRSKNLIKFYIKHVNFVRNINVCNKSSLFIFVKNKQAFISGKVLINTDRNVTTNTATGIDKTEDNEIVDFEAITNGDPELEHKLKVLLLEVEVMRQDGMNVPDKNYMKTHQWQELIQLPSRSARRKFLNYLFKLSKKKENEKLKKQEKRLKREANPVIKEEIKDDEIRYGLSDNNIFLRFYDTTMNQMYNNRLIQAIQFGQKLVVDCGFDEQMTKRENRNCAKQLTLLFAENRSHKDPFDLHYCNINPNSELIRSLGRGIGTMYEPWFPLHLHEQSYLDIFSKEQLVYLTPHTKEVMEDYDHDAIYIIGGIVDKTNNQPVSLAKAKKDGLKMAKLPLDKYLQWGSGSGKSLTLNQVVAILLDLKLTGDWKYSLRHVPRRKIVDFSAECSNILQSPNSLRYDKERFQRKWSPSVNFDKLGYNRQGIMQKKEKSGR